jgi:peptide/nickel transport system ATP-binding protein
MNNNNTILEVTDLSKHFRSRRGLVSALTGHGRVIPAVDGVSFYLRENETVGLVGESGCGKTTVARTVLRLTDPSGGRILLGGRDITHLRRAELRPLRREMQMIFQDLDAGLNPKMSVRAILREALTVYERPSDAEVARRTRELLEQVNLKESKLATFPAELSGGEKRRVGIARVLAVRPRLIVADEPTSALDVSVQAAILNLLSDLQLKSRTSYLLISHDLGVVRYLADRIAVMYLGRIMEVGDSETVFRGPNHPYTEALLSAVPNVDGTQGARILLEGEIPSPANPPTGCKFQTRCHRMMPGICDVVEPPLAEVEPGHLMSCHIPLEELRLLQRKAREEAAEGVTLTSVAPTLEQPPEDTGDGTAVEETPAAAGGDGGADEAHP